MNIMKKHIYHSIDDLPDFCTVTDFSGLFGVSRATAYRMAAQGNIPCIHIGRRVVMSREHIRRWADQAAGMGA